MSANTVIKREKLNFERAGDAVAAARRPEVLFVWNYTEWGGAQIYFLGIMRFLQAKNYKVRAVMPAGTSDKLLGYLARENVSVDFFPARIDVSKAAGWRAKIYRRTNDLQCHWTLWRHLKRYDLTNKIIQIEAAPWSAASLLFLLALKTHVFVTLHISQNDSPSWRNRWVRLKYQLLCRAPKFHLLTSNDDMRRSLRWFVGERRAEKIPIAYTGVNTSEIQSVLAQPCERELTLKKYDLPENRQLIFSLANIVERKGFRVLLDAARLLKNENLFFVWIGDGEKFVEMQNLIAEFDLRNSVKIIRPAEIGENREDLLNLLRVADVFVHPSYAEGLPGAMLEAMALGVPVVVSKINAVPEAVKNMENGVLVRAGDVGNFAAAIEKLTKDEKLRRRLASSGQETVLRQFTEERCAEVTVDFYEDCLKIG